jgi:CheY-like chemotaxis protein
MKVMIVDDNAVVRQTISKLLASPRVAIRECASGEEALRAALEFKPDWIIMDIQMPGLNGFEATEALLAKFPATRVVIVTAHDRQYMRDAARAAGAVAYLCKENLIELRRILSDGPGNSWAISSPNP